MEFALCVDVSIAALERFESFTKLLIASLPELATYVLHETDKHTQRDSEDGHSCFRDGL